MDDDRSHITWADVFAKNVPGIEFTGLQRKVVTSSIPASLDSDPYASEIPAKASVTTGVVCTDDSERIFDPLVSHNWVDIVSSKRADPQAVNNSPLRKAEQQALR